jgi:hypothetical protein
MIDPFIDRYIIRQRKMKKKLTQSSGNSRDRHILEAEAYPFQILPDMGGTTVILKSHSWCGIFAIEQTVYAPDRQLRALIKLRTDGNYRVEGRSLSTTIRRQLAIMPVENLTNPCANPGVIYSHELTGKIFQAGKYEGNELRHILTWHFNAPVGARFYLSNSVCNVHVALA